GLPRAPGGAAQGPADLRDLRERQPVRGRDLVPAPERLDRRGERRRRDDRVGTPGPACQPRRAVSRRGLALAIVAPYADRRRSRRLRSRSRNAATFSLWANAQPMNSRITKFPMPT